MLYPEKENGLPKAAVILRDKTQTVTQSGCAKGLSKMSMAVVFKLWSPDIKASTTSGNLLEMPKPQVPTDSLGLGPSHLHFNKVPGSYGSWSTRRSTGIETWGSCPPADPSPDLHNWPVGP